MAMTIGKIEASERQLNESIQMWLDARDALSIHTLAMAGFGVLKDLHCARFSEEKTDPLRGLLSQLAYNEFNKLSNFLKHADRDPDATISIPDDKLNESRIGMCISILRCLGRSLSPTLGAFHLMSLMTYPEQFQIAPDPDQNIELGANGFALLAQRDVNLRRKQVRTNMSLMAAGLIHPDISIKRLHHEVSV